MKRIIVLLLTLLMVVSFCGCMNGNSASAAASTEYASQEDFLKDMATGISSRLAAVDDSKERTDDEKSEYYQKLVGYELNKIEKYADKTFEDATFDEMAHYYIDACMMQRFAAQNYRNENLYAIWSNASGVRNDIIVEMYSRYNLPITSEEAAQYSSDISVTYSITGLDDAVSVGLDSSSNGSQDSAEEAVEIVSCEAELSSGYYHLNFTVKNVSDNPIKIVTLNVNFMDKDGNILSSTHPQESARLLNGQTEVITALVKAESNVYAAYIDSISYHDANDSYCSYYTAEPTLYTFS